MHRFLIIGCLLFTLAAAALEAQPVGKWEEQPTSAPVRGLMGIAMADTGNGYAVGDVDVLKGQTGILVKRAGNPTWQLVPSSAFTPPLNIALSSWAQDVYAVPNTGVAYVSWRDDYRSLVYKTLDYGYSWFSVSPQNPILYGIRYALTFKDLREGMIVGEGPGRVHHTTDGGTSWRSYILPVAAPLTDVKFTGSLWFVSGGENALFRYNPSNQRWTDLSFRRSVEFYGSHIKISYVDDDHGFLYGFNQGTGKHLLITTNGGVDWLPSNAQPPIASTPGAHRGVFFFDTLKGWVASRYNEFAYTGDGGSTWTVFQPNIFGNKTYQPVNKMVFLNEGVGWAVGGYQRASGYPSVSEGWIFKWTGSQRPDISGTAVTASFDTLACGPWKDLNVPIVNQGTGNLTIPRDGITFTNPDFVLRNVTWPIVVPPGETREVTVRWEPAVDYYGPVPSGSTMRITSNDPDHNPWTVGLLGMRVLNELRPLAARMVFPSVCRLDTATVALPVDTYGNRAPRIIGIENLGARSTVELISHAVDDSIRGADSLVFILRSGASGPVTGSIRLLVGHPDCPETVLIPYEGFIESNRMQIAPGEIEFADVCVGSERIEYIELRNTGNQTGRVAAILQTEGKPDFSVLADTSQRIDASGTLKVPVRFAPMTADSTDRAAVFRIVLGPCPDTLDLICSGRGVGAVLRSEPDTALIIGPVPLNVEVRRTVTFRNRGYDDAEIAKLWFDPPVAGLSVAEPAALPAALPRGGSVPVIIAYRAPLPDSGATMLRIALSAPCPDTLLFPVRFRSAELPFAVITDSLRFDDQICDGPVVDSIEIRNGGQQPLQLRRSDLGGLNPTHFTVLRPKLPLVLPPDSSVFLVLQYNAPSNQESRAELIIRHNDSSRLGETRVRLSGTRSVRTLAVDGDTLSPLALCIGSEGTRGFMLRNPHDAPLQITSIELLSGMPFATLRHGALPAEVLPKDAFPLDVAVTVPSDTIVTVILRVRIEPCSVEYLLHFDAGVYHPRLVVVPDPLDFGVRALADTSRLLVHVANRDSMEVRVAGMHLSGAAGTLRLEAPPMPRMLWPDSLLSATMQLEAFKDTGTVAATLCVVLSSPCPDTLCFPLRLRIENRAIVASADTITQLHLFCDTLRCDTVTVTNTLSEAQRIEPVLLNPAVFSVHPDTVVTLDPGGRIAFTICSRRPATADARGELQLRGSSGAISVVQLRAIREDGSVLLPDTIDAGNIPHCEQEHVVSRQIFNTASVAEILLDAVISDPAFELLTQLPLTVPPGAPATLRLRYRPPAAGTHSAILTLRSRLGDCERDTRIVIIGRHGAPYIEASPASLLFANVVAGTSQARTLVIRNRDMAGLRLAGIRVSPDPPFAVSPLSPQVIDTGAALSVDVRFLPDSVGTYFGTLCLLFDRPCEDTICVALEGQAIDGDLVYSAPELRFDSLAQCEEETSDVLLHNTGGSDVELRSSMVSGAGAAAFTVLNPVTAVETLPAGQSRGFRLRFVPGAVPDGPAAASLFVSTSAPKQPVLELPLYGTRVTHVQPAEAVYDLGPVLVGSPVSMTRSLTNSGSAVLELRAFSGPAGYVLLSPTLPVRLLPGASIDLVLRYTPVAEGPAVDSVFVELGPCGDTLRTVVRSSGVRHFVQTDLDFGDLPFCETRSGFVSLTANVAPELEVEAVSIVGAAADRFAFSPAPSLPLTLKEFESTQVHLLFTPAPADRGAVTASLESRVRIAGQVFIFRSALRAFVRDGGLAFPADLQLGASPLGVESSVQEFSGRNTASFPVTIASLTPQSARLRIVETIPALPAVFAPGDSLRVRCTFTPDRQGAMTDSLLLEATAPCAAVIPVPCRFSGEGDLFAVDLRVPEIRGAVDDTVTVPVQLTRDISGLGIRRWTGTLAFNPTMLYPLAVDVGGSASEAMRVRWTYDHAGALTVTADSGAMTADEELFRVRMLVLVGSDTVSALQTRDVEFRHPAVRIGRHAEGRFILDGYCLADGRRLLRSRNMTLAPPAPNPVQARVTIAFSLQDASSVRVSVLDGQGREIAVPVDGRLERGSHRTVFDAAPLPAGSYFILLRSGGEALMRRMTVVR